MQKGWTPKDFSAIESEDLWNYYIVAYEMAQEQKCEMLNEYVKLGVMAYGG